MTRSSIHTFSLALAITASALAACAKSGGSHAASDAASPSTASPSSLFFNYPLDAFAEISNKSDPNYNTPFFEQQSAMAGTLTDGGSFGFNIVDQQEITPRSIVWNLQSGVMTFIGPGSPGAMAPPATDATADQKAGYLQELATIAKVLKNLNAPAQAQAYVASVIAQLGGS